MTDLTIRKTKKRTREQQEKTIEETLDE